MTHYELEPDETEKLRREVEKLKTRIEYWKSLAMAPVTCEKCKAMIKLKS